MIVPRGGQQQPRAKFSTSISDRAMARSELQKVINRPSSGKGKGQQGDLIFDLQVQPAACRLTIQPDADSWPRNCQAAAFYPEGACSLHGSVTADAAEEM